MLPDITHLRSQFPFFTHRSTVTYLDSASTAQKPLAVLDAMRNFTEEHNANVHRGVHGLSEEATDAYEDARRTVQTFLHAKHTGEIVFTKNTTEAINLVAQSWGRKNLKKGDVIVLSILEHHSNIVPWMMLKETNGIEIKWIDIDDDGSLKMEQLDAYLQEGNVKLIAVTGQSNVLGTRPDLTTIIERGHAAGALILVDAAQLAAHHAINVAELDCDFLAFSGHKVYGPTGIGVLYAKRDLLEAMPPFLGGGTMIRDVNLTGFTPADIPQRFEAGTPPIVEAVGLDAALTWLMNIPITDRETHESSLIQTAIDTLTPIEGLTLYPINQSTNQLINSSSGCLSFTIAGIHPHDLTSVLSDAGFHLRAGHHCAQPLHERLGVPATTRLSVGLYNTVEEIRALGPVIQQAIKTLHP